MQGICEKYEEFARGQFEKLMLKRLTEYNFSDGVINGFHKMSEIVCMWAVDASNAATGVR